VSTVVTSFAKTGASMNTNQYTAVRKVGFSKNYADREVSNSNVSGTNTKRACYVSGSYYHLQNFNAKVANKYNTPSTTPKRVNVVNTNSPVSLVEGVSVVSTALESGRGTISAHGSGPTSSAPGVSSQNSADTNIKAFVCDVAVYGLYMDVMHNAVTMCVMLLRQMKAACQFIRFL